MEKINKTGLEYLLRRRPSPHDSGANAGDIAGSHIRLRHEPEGGWSDRATQRLGEIGPVNRTEAMRSKDCLLKSLDQGLAHLRNLRIKIEALQ